MRVSRLMLVTLRDAPADAEIISHKLLLRGGYIKRVTSGIYAYMPLMWKVIKKITCIIREELDAIDSLEVLLPQLHPAELWEQSGRWQGYTDGEGIMFHLIDRQGRQIGLGPTHEEVITKIADEVIHSYKQLPITIYQIQTKFRDEIRPRFGLMRSREFIMKDAYSFHKNEESLKEKYREMNKAYERIFNRCGLKTVAVDADSGAIGGAASQEFMVTANSGEDSILISSDRKYAANQEKAVSRPKASKPLPKREPALIETTNQSTIQDLCLSQDLEASQIVKVIIFLAILDNKVKQPILVSIRGDQDLNEVKLSNAISKHLNQNVISLNILTKEESISQNLQDLPIGFLGPDLDDSTLKASPSWEKSFLRFVDNTAAELNSFVCGANKINTHKAYMNWSLINYPATLTDIRTAKSGDICHHDENCKLEEKRGIEVGHIFQLGRKYSTSLEAKFSNEKGNEEPFWMGCYGIGVSRLAQAAVEQNHDEFGVIWPTSIAPFEVIVIVANVQNQIQSELAEKIYLKLTDSKVDVLLDDRDERAGVKFKDADLIGIPWKIVVGREAEQGRVELVKRSNKEVQVDNSKNIIKKLLAEICSERRAIGPSSL